MRIRLHDRDCPISYNQKWELNTLTLTHVYMRQILANLLFFWKPKVSGEYFVLFTTFTWRP